MSAGLWILLPTAATLRRFQAPSIIDDYSRGGIAIRLAFPSVARMVCPLERLGETRDLSDVITMDNDPEFTDRELDEWAYRHGVKLNFIRSGKPIEKAFTENFNGILRNEYLNKNWFRKLKHTREAIKSWRKDHNEARPYGSLDGSRPIPEKYQIILP